MNFITRAPRRDSILNGGFDDFIGGFLSSPGLFEPAESHMTPAMDILENKDGYVVKADLPGVSKDDLKVSVKDDLLTIDAESKSEYVEKSSESVIRMERRSGKIHRMLKLCKTIDDSAITAEYKDGVLTLTLPRAEKEDSRKIDVSIN